MNTYLATYDQVEDEPILPWAPIFKLNDYQPDDHLNYQTFTTLVAEGDSLASVAKRLNFSSSQLAIWNNISPLDSLTEGQVIKFFQPVLFHDLPMREIASNNWRAPHLQADKIVSTLSPVFHALPSAINVKFCFQLNRREKPSEILSRFPKVDNEQFYQQNDLSKDRALPVGRLIYLPSR